MIKGVCKNIVVIKSPKSDIIEEAIFIIKPEAYKSGVAKADMLTEAVRIIDLNTNEKTATKSYPSFRHLGK